MAMKPNGKSIVSSDYDENVMFFKDRIVIQRFISPGRIEKYLPEMKRGSVYKLNNFYGSRNKSVFRVADHTATVSFSWNSDLSVLQDCRTPFDEDSFRFHSYEEFQANSDLKGDLYGKLCNSPHHFLVALLDD
ncbi:BnaAnng33840D [Brassica napus]|uniref:BnaAnng33840D protein n=1 Tax=Brassica napus TaxID=3708 RepID=A0A078JYD6_BRANA|nr:BnaAnng33840D [Brassica napus]